MSVGVVYVAFGSNALREARLSANTLPEGLEYYIHDTYDSDSSLSAEQQAHFAKTKAAMWSPYDHTLLLDADTRVLDDLSFGFSLISTKCELVMVPSFPLREGSVLWNLSPEEKDYTFQKLGAWSHVMLNTGVMFFRKTSRVLSLFQVWSDEWLKFKDRDQGAFLRALIRAPVIIRLLGADYNSADGKIVKHLFGRAV